MLFKATSRCSIWVWQARGGMCAVPAWRRRRWWVDASWTAGLSSAAGCSPPHIFLPAGRWWISATPAPREPPPPARSAQTPPGAPPAGAPSPWWRAGAPPPPGDAGEQPRTPCWSWEWRVWRRAPWRRRTGGRNGPTEHPSHGGSLPWKWSAWWPERPLRGRRRRTRTAAWQMEEEEGRAAMRKVSQVGGDQDAGLCFPSPRRWLLCGRWRLSGSCFSAAASWPRSSSSSSSSSCVKFPRLPLLRQSADVRRSGWKQLHSWVGDVSRERAEALRACGGEGRGGACMAADDWAARLFAADAAALSFCCRHLHLRPKQAEHASAAAPPPLRLALAPSFSLLDSLCSLLLPPIW